MDPVDNVKCAIKMPHTHARITFWVVGSTKNVLNYIVRTFGEAIMGTNTKQCN